MMTTNDDAEIVLLTLQSISLFFCGTLCPPHPPFSLFLNEIRIFRSGLCFVMFNRFSSSFSCEAMCCHSMSGDLHHSPLFFCLFFGLYRLQYGKIDAIIVILVQRRTNKIFIVIYLSSYIFHYHYYYRYHYHY